MKLYNQSGRPLRWDISMTTFTCEPYGEVDVPDMFVEHCKVRGLPLDVTKVPPEVKASNTAEAATDSAKKDEVAALNKQLTSAVASEKSAKSEVEKLLANVVTLGGEKIALELSLSQSESKFTTLVGDNAALNKLFEEQAKELEICKQERDRAVGTIEELKKAPASVPVKEENKPAKK